MDGLLELLHQTALNRDLFSLPLEKQGLPVLEARVWPMDAWPMGLAAEGSLPRGPLGGCISRAVSPLPVWACTPITFGSGLEACLIRYCSRIFLCASGCTGLSVSLYATACHI